jgi:hypothetical protein
MPRLKPAHQLREGDRILWAGTTVQVLDAYRTTSGLVWLELATGNAGPVPRDEWYTVAR